MEFYFFADVGVFTNIIVGATCAYCLMEKPMAEDSFGSVMPKTKSDFESFLNSIVNDLQIIIEKGQL